MSLIENCDEGTEVILVYKLMKNEALRNYVNHTDGENSTSLFELL
jgi:hypothetical protein